MFDLFTVFFKKFYWQGLEVCFFELVTSGRVDRQSYNKNLYVYIYCIYYSLSVHPVMGM